MKKMPSKAVLAAILAAHICVATLTWRDLRRRPDSLVRGSKRAWRGATALNSGSSALYWLFGRKRAA